MLLLRAALNEQALKREVLRGRGNPDLSKAMADALAP